MSATRGPIASGVTCRLPRPSTSTPASCTSSSPASALISPASISVSADHSSPPISSSPSEYSVTYAPGRLPVSRSPRSLSTSTRNRVTPPDSLRAMRTPSTCSPAPTRPDSIARSVYILDMPLPPEIEFALIMPENRCAPYACIKQSFPKYSKDMVSDFKA